MQFGSSSFGSVSLGSIEQDPGASNVEALSPIVVELNGVDIRAAIRMDTLKVMDTLGQPVTAAFRMVNLAPQVGDQIRIRYFSQVIFAGTIDHVDVSSPDLSTFWYDVDCLDWSQTLLRRKLRRNFTNLPLVNVIDSILDNELAGEGLTIGTIETGSILPLVDSKNAKVFDVMRQMAGATGQTFYVEYDKSIQMRSAAAPVAPLVLNEVNTLLDATSLKQDRETYRNRQIIVVTGTLPTGTSGEALVVSVQRQSDGQIALRQSIEGGTGVYEEIEEVTHPTSNDAGQLALLGIGYANLRLAVSGEPRFTFRCSAQGYGFRAGQIATVDLPTFGVSGTYIIQRVSIRERIGALLFHDLELTNSSLQQRAYEAWLNIVKAGKVVVHVPSAVTNNLQSFVTPGFDSFVVPAGVTLVELTTFGGSAGGGGGARMTAMNGLVEKCHSGVAYGGGENDGCNAGAGGNSGKSITLLSVVPGDTLTVFVGSAGTGGLANGIPFPLGMGVGAVIKTTAADGVDGTASSVTYHGTVVCQGDGGLKGTKAICTATRTSAFNYQMCKTIGTNGASGSGIGDAVSPGGGMVGGAKGLGSAGSLSSGSPGSDGRVEVRW